MKSNIKILTILLTVFLTIVILPKQTSAQQGNVSFQVFYDQLSPYGEWVDYPNYGYVWIPSVGSDFVPYSTAGHWILTDYGWTWASDYDWGWAPFHYGRWASDNNYGWFWVPGNQWGPSWVNWRRSNGYYGWEPMEPGVSISVSFGSRYDRGNDHWTFVRNRDFDRRDINRYYVNRNEHESIIRNSIIINKTYIDNSRHTTYVYGPRREDVQKYTGRSVRPVVIRENNKPGQSLSNGQLRIYRPEVKKNNVSGQKAVPTRISNLRDVKRPTERIVKNQPQKVNSPNINKQAQQPNAAKPQMNINKAKPAQPRNINPTQNNRTVQQPKTVNPQNNVNSKKPVQPRITNPNQNNTRIQQPRAIKPQNNIVRPVQPQRANPNQNNNRVQQPRIVTPQNNVRPVQPRNVNPPQNNRTVQQPRAVIRPANNTRIQQPRVSKPEEDKKR
jgi:hypothetical protein